MANNMDPIMKHLQSIDESPIEGEMLQEGLSGTSNYENMNAVEQEDYNKLAYDFFNNIYQSRDKQKFGRLSFEDYVAAVTPDEGFITELGQMPADDPTETDATRWMEVYGEDTDQMRAAAIKFASTMQE